MNRRFNGMAFAIFGLSLVLRLAYFFWLRSDPVLPNIVSQDTGIYLERATEIAAGDLWGSEPHLHSGILYAYLIALAGGPQRVALLQALAGAASSAVVFGLGRAIGGHRVGIVAGLLHAISAVFVFASGNLLFDPWVTFFTLLAVLGVRRAAQRMQPRAWFAAGAALAVAITAKAFVLLYLPLVLLAWFLPAHAPTRRRLAEAAAATALGVVLVLAPISLRNWRVSGELLPFPITGGLSFYLGNNPLATGVPILPRHLGISREATAYADSLLTYPSSRLGRPVTHSEASAFWLREGLSWWREEPVAAAALTVRKIAILFNAEEVNDNYDFDVFRSRIGLLRWLPTSAWILPPALLGVALGLRRWRRSGFALTMVGVFVGVLPFFTVTSRYRLPLLALLFPFAALALVEWIRALRRRRIGFAVSGAAVMLAAACLVTYPLEGLSAGPLTVVQLARAQLAAGDSRGALDVLEDGLDRWNHATLHLYRGKALLAEGRVAEAREAAGKASFQDPSLGEAHDLIEEIARAHPTPEEIELRQAALAAPDRPEPHLALAQFYYAQARYNEAIRASERAALLDPALDDAIFLLAVAFSRRGMPEAAIPRYQRLLERHPDQPDVLANLAFGHLDAGHLDEAEERFRQLRARHPDNHLAHYGMGLLHKFRGNIDASRGEFERYLSSVPANSTWAAEARKNLEELEGKRR